MGKHDFLVDSNRTFKENPGKLGQINRQIKFIVIIEDLNFDIFIFKILLRQLI